MSEKSDKAAERAADRAEAAEERRLEQASDLREAIANEDAERARLMNPAGTHVAVVEPPLPELPPAVDVPDTEAVSVQEVSKPEQTREDRLAELHQKMLATDEEVAKSISYAERIVNAARVRQQVARDAYNNFLYVR